MNLGEIRRLREEQDKAIENSDSKILQWTKFKEDYVSLQKRLSTLPDKVTHDVMVPFGDLAFMPGHLVHTNEINVLLGDNWFVERSAKQAAEIVSRRLKSINTNLEDLDEEKNLLKPRQKFTEELEEMAKGTSDMKDITEVLDAEQEKKWRAQHKDNVKRHRAKVNADRKKDDLSKQEDKDLWARLDQLEKEEDEKGELDQISSGEEEALTEPTVPQKGQQRVSWVDDSTHTDSDSSENDTSESYYDSDSEDQVAEQQKSCINFSHTVLTKLSSSDSNSDAEACPIKSPADIYKQFGKSTTSTLPKSILKKKTKTFKVSDLLDDEEELKPIFSLPKKDKQNAFSGTVVEKQPNKMDVGPSLTASSTAASSRPVSKFKSRRNQASS